MTNRIFRTTWYERGIAHGNPDFNSRFRVNAPGAALDPEFAHRDEVRGNGMLQVLIEEDLRRLAGAELQVVHWGGHPGTANKRVTVNGRTTYALPETGTAAGHCTHGYPAIRLALTDLVNGYNVAQFACDQGTSFWGHFIVDDAALRVELPSDHPDVVAARLDHLDATVVSSPLDEERVEVRLTASEPAAFAAVDFVGIYEGYDENGNGLTYDAHGFIKNRRRVAILGRATSPPFEVIWDRTMLPACESVSVYAVATHRDQPNLELVTSPVLVAPIAHAAGEVRLIETSRLPVPFWSRVNEPRTCTFRLDTDPADISSAELHSVIWDGGCGTVSDPVTLNGHPLDLVGEGAHDVRYRIVPVDAGWLQQGTNTLRVLSDTDHHGIEVLLPGPALVVRDRGER